MTGAMSRTMCGNSTSDLGKCDWQAAPTRETICGRALTAQIRRIWTNGPSRATPRAGTTRAVKSRAEARWVTAESTCGTARGPARDRSVDQPVPVGNRARGSTSRRVTSSPSGGVRLSTQSPKRRMVRVM